MAATLNATSRLGAFVAAMAGAELAPDVAVKAAICLLDPLGLAPAAREEPTAMVARSMTMGVPPGPRAARVWATERTWLWRAKPAGSRQRFSPRHAAADRCLFECCLIASSALTGKTKNEPWA
jgi:hypothetical protein